MAARVRIIDTETNTITEHYSVDAKDLLHNDKSGRFKVVSLDEAVALSRASDTEAKTRRREVQERMDAEAAERLPIFADESDLAPKPDEPETPTEPEAEKPKAQRKRSRRKPADDK